MNSRSRRDLMLGRSVSVAAAALCASAFAVAILETHHRVLLASQAQQSSCRIAGDVIRIRELPEGSGVAASRRTRGLFWAHNDSGRPVLFALNDKGLVTGRVRVAGAAVDDWEDIAAGPCPEGPCLYIADIGDNSGDRKQITVYRVPEPSPQESNTRPVEVFHARYPDGAHDAEALFVTANSDVFIITKGDPSPVALYRFPRPLRSGSPMQLERVGEPVSGTKVADRDRPTAVDLSPDGRWVAVRTTHHVAFYRAADLTAGRWREEVRADLSGLREPRGEGITFGSDGTLILVGEGGSSGPGTFARLICTLPE